MRDERPMNEAAIQAPVEGRHGVLNDLGKSRAAREQAADGASRYQIHVGETEFSLRNGSCKPINCISDWNYIVFPIRNSNAEQLTAVEQFQ